MKRYARITQPPYRTMVTREWRRAHRLLAPTLDWVIVPPVVLWDRRAHRRRLAYTIFSDSRTPALTIFTLPDGRRDFPPQEFRAVAIICVTFPELTDPEDFRTLLRHEIAHLPVESVGHNGRFHALLRILHDCDGRP